MKLELRAPSVALARLIFRSTPVMLAPDDLLIAHIRSMGGGRLRQSRTFIKSPYLAHGRWALLRRFLHQVDWVGHTPETGNPRQSSWIRPGWTYARNWQPKCSYTLAASVMNSIDLLRLSILSQIPTIWTISGAVGTMATIGVQ